MAIPLVTLDTVSEMFYLGDLPRLHELHLVEREKDDGGGALRARQGAGQVRGHHLLAIAGCQCDHYR